MPGVPDVQTRASGSAPARAGVAGFVPPRGCRESEDPGDLADILLPEVNVAVWRRPVDPRIVSYLTSASVLAQLGSGVNHVLARDEPLAPPAFPDHPGRAALLADLDLLARLFADLLDCPRVAMRVEVLRRAMCPRFHVDRIGVRLLCTHQGPGTEWVPGDRVDRSRLGVGAGGLADHASGLLHDPADIRVIAPGFVALLKGEAWPGNDGRGAVHRSPAVPTGAPARVLVALDAVW